MTREIHNVVRHVTRCGRCITATMRGSNPLAACRYANELASKVRKP